MREACGGPDKLTIFSPRRSTDGVFSGSRCPSCPNQMRSRAHQTTLPLALIRSVLVQTRQSVSCPHRRAPISPNTIIRDRFISIILSFHRVATTPSLNELSPAIPCRVTQQILLHSLSIKDVQRSKIWTPTTCPASVLTIRNGMPGSSVSSCFSRSVASGGIKLASAVSPA